MRAPASRQVLTRHVLVRRLLIGAGVGGAAALLACGIGIRRDYSAIPAGQVGFDDLCGLQDYFDTMEARLAKPPTVVSGVDIENANDKRAQGGKNRFAFDTEFQVDNFRRLLAQNYSGLPDSLAKANRIELEVHWSTKAGVRRVVTNVDAEMTIGAESFPLPYHVCLAEFLYGEPLYRQRREMTGRPLPYRSLLGNDDGGRATPGEGAAPGAMAPAAVDAGHVTAPASGFAPAAAPVHDDGPPASARPIFKAAPPAQ
jgi:hypothetical protein